MSKLKVGDKFNAGGKRTVVAQEEHMGEACNLCTFKDDQGDSIECDAPSEVRMQCSTVIGLFGYFKEVTNDEQV